MKAVVTFHPLQNDLFAYSGGELPSEVVAEIRLHLESCAICRREVETWEDVRQRTADHFQSLVVTAAPPADAWSRIQVEAARPVTVRPLFGGSLLTQAATIAMVGVLLLMVGLGVNTIVAGSTGGGFAPLFVPPATPTMPVPSTPQPTSGTENPAVVPVLPDAEEASTPLAPTAGEDAPEQGMIPTVIPSPTESEPIPTVEPSPTPRPSRTPTETPEPTVEPSATLPPTPTQVPPTPTMVPATPTAIPATTTPVVTVEPTVTPSDGSVPPPWSEDPPGNADPPAPVPPPWSDDPPGNPGGDDNGNGNGNGGGNNGNGGGGNGNGNGGGGGNGNGNGGGGTP